LVPDKIISMPWEPSPDDIAKSDVDVLPPVSENSPHAGPENRFTINSPIEHFVSRVLAGTDPTQMTAAQNLRLPEAQSNLDEQPDLGDPYPTVGVIARPREMEMLAHVSHRRRRWMLHSLIANQRERLQQISRSLTSTELINVKAGDDQSLESPEQSRSLQELQNDLDRVARMLDVLDHLSSLQDYAVAQIASFQKG